MQAVYKQMEAVCGEDVPVLLLGSTGTGKGLVARTLHEHSLRRGKPFLHQNCAAMPRDLLESELFGHCKGSFTGAGEDRKGIFEAAEGGTVFLDEIGEAPPAVQVRLLHVLEEGTIRRVGENTNRSIHVRILAATHRNLEAEVEARRFREDLYYRLRVFPIRAPDLQERVEDIPLLARHFLAHFLAHHPTGKFLPGFDPEVIQALCAYDWPGNIRELENEVRRCVITVPPGERVALDHLPRRIARCGLRDRMAQRVRRSMGTRQALKRAVEFYEREFILTALAQRDWNVTHTASGLGLSRVGLQKKMRKYQIHKEL